MGFLIPVCVLVIRVLLTESKVKLVVELLILLFNFANLMILAFRDLTIQDWVLTWNDGLVVIVNLGFNFNVLIDWIELLTLILRFDFLFVLITEVCLERDTVPVCYLHTIYL